MKRFISALKIMRVPFGLVVLVMLVSLHLFNQSLNYMGMHTEATLRDAIMVTENTLRHNAEERVASISRSAVRKLDIYLAAHPKLTIEEFFKDEFIKELVTQSVGVTGYITIHEVETTLLITHPQPEPIGQIFADNKELQEPQFESIRKLVVEGSEHPDPISGYYIWPQPDGRTIEKYLVNIATKNKTGSGTHLRIIASVPIEELLTQVHGVERLYAEGQRDLNALTYSGKKSLYKVFGVLFTIAIVMLFSIAYFIQCLCKDHQRNRILEMQMLKLRVSTTLLAVLFVVVGVTYGFYSMQQKVEEMSELIINNVLTYTQEIIRTDSEMDVARIARQATDELDLYLELNPKLGPALSLIGNETLLAIVSEPVGETGYVLIAAADNFMFITHPNPTLIGKVFWDLPALDRPIFDEVKALVRRAQNQSNEVVSAYYAWLEQDGRITEKYGTDIATKNTLANGERFIVASTAYMKDFNYSERGVRHQLEQGLEVLKEHTTERLRNLLIMMGGLFIMIKVPYVWWLRRSIIKQYNRK